MVLFLAPITVAIYAFYQKRKKKDETEDKLQHLDRGVLSGGNSDADGEDRVTSEDASFVLSKDKFVTPASDKDVHPLPKKVSATCCGLSRSVENQVAQPSQREQHVRKLTW
jgi:hypothetical protein